MKKRILAVLLFLIAAVLLLSSCDLDFITDLLPQEHVHEYGKWSIATEATCTEDGVMYRECDCGEKEYTSIVATGHTESEWITKSAPTCTEAGEKYKECTACHEILETGIISANGHEYGTWISEVLPKCTETGTLGHYHCSVCEKDFDINTNELENLTIAASGHSHTSVVTKPTCTEQGYTTHTCHCGDSYVDSYIVANGHYHTSVVTEPTCTDQGYTTYTCYCGNTYIGDYIDAKGHNYVNKVCTLCGKLQPSEGLAFTLSDDGTYYIVSGIGSCKETDVVIPDTYNNLHVTAIGDSAFSGRTELTSITISNSITSIGYSSFSDCIGLRSITIPNSVNSIGSYAFCNCTELANITIGNQLTSIGFYAFSNTKYYNETQNWENGVLYVNKYLIAAKESIYGKYTVKEGTILIADNAFYGCANLTNIVLPNSVIAIGYNAFSWCSGLESISLGNNVTTIGSYAFAWSGLKSVRIGKKVSSINSDAFCGCASLTSVYFNGTINEWVEISFANRFSNPLYYAENLYISNNMVEKANITTATKISSYAFYGYDKLKSVTIGYKITAIGDYAFNGCTALTEINYNAINCDNLDSNNRVYTDAGQNGDGIKVTIGKSVKKLPAYLFYGASQITEVVFEDGSVCESIGECAFYNCSRITEMKLPNSLTSIGSSAFWACIEFTSITIPDNITSIGNDTFTWCVRLTTVKIPNSVTSIGDCAFSQCGNLTSIYYNGTPSQWDDITKARGWDYDTGNYTVYFEE